MNDIQRRTLRNMTYTFYDFQKLRISTGNRIVGDYKARLGQYDDAKSEWKEEGSLSVEAKKVLAALRASFKTLAEGLQGQPPPREFVGAELIPTALHYRMMEAYLGMERNEKPILAGILAFIDPVPIWRLWLRHIRGIGPTMGAVLLSYFSIERAPHASSFARYAGLHVVRNAESGAGHAPSKRNWSKIKPILWWRNGAVLSRAPHPEEESPQSKPRLGYSPFLQGKLLGVLADSFIKSGSPYKVLYDNYKTRLESHAVYGIQNDAERTRKKLAPKMHRHRMACRYMMRIFLHEFWAAWRAMEGLPVEAPYYVDKLGYEPHSFIVPFVMPSASPEQCITEEDIAEIA